MRFQYPHLYGSEASVSLVSRARNKMLDLIQGILPKGRKEYYADKGRDIYEQATGGRSIYDKLTGRGVGDKAADTLQDISYGARRGVEQAKDIGYGIGSRISDMASSVKDTIVGHGDERDYIPRDTYGGRESQGGWFSGGGRDRDQYSRDQRDELSMATDQLRNVMRSAERNM